MCALCLGGLLFARARRLLEPRPGAGWRSGSSSCSWSCGSSCRRSRTTRPARSRTATGGLLVGWAISEYLRVRYAWPLWAIGALAVVFGLTVLWELGEYLGDRAFNTALIPSRRDSALDITFGTLGGVARHR